MQTVSVIRGEAPEFSEACCFPSSWRYLRAGWTIFSRKEPGSKYFRFCESDCSVLTGQLCHCSLKTSTNNTQTNECGCVPMWFYENRRRPDLAHGLQFANLWLRGKNNWENRVRTDRTEGMELNSSLLILSWWKIWDFYTFTKQRKLWHSDKNHP